MKLDGKLHQGQDGDGPKGSCCRDGLQDGLVGSCEKWIQDRPGPRGSFKERSWPSPNITNVAIANSTGETVLVARVAAAASFRTRTSWSQGMLAVVASEPASVERKTARALPTGQGEPGCGRWLSGAWRGSCQGGIEVLPLRLRPRKETRHQRGSQYRSGGVVLMRSRGRRRETPQIPHFYPKPGSRQWSRCQTRRHENIRQLQHQYRKATWLPSFPSHLIPHQPNMSCGNSTSHHRPNPREACLPKVGGYFLLYTRTHSHLPFPPSPNHPSALHKN